MVRKVKEKFENNGNVENNDKSEKYILRGEKNARHNDRIPCKSKEIQQEFH